MVIVVKSRVGQPAAIRRPGGIAAVSQQPEAVAVCPEQIGAISKETAIWPFSSDDGIGLTMMGGWLAGVLLTEGGVRCEQAATSNKTTANTENDDALDMAYPPVPQQFETVR
jgi:hypothetical protein